MPGLGCSILLALLPITGFLSWLRSRVESEVSAKVWRPSAEGFDFPEFTESPVLRDYLLKRPDFGIAIAGGGTRGLAMGQGVLRELRKAGILDATRYLSFTSGSLWLGLPLYYQHTDSLDKLFGETMPPEELTPEALTSSKVGSFLRRLTFFNLLPAGAEQASANRSSPLLRGAEGANAEAEREESERRLQAEVQMGLAPGALGQLLGCMQGLDLCGCLVKAGLPDTSLAEVAGALQAYVFLHPFGLAGPFSSVCHETQLNRTRAKLGPGAEIYVARDMSQGLPYLLTQSAVLAPLSGRDPEHPVTAFPLEQTPLYTGVFGSYRSERAYPYEALGDVLVEPYAWPGTPLEPARPGPRSEMRIKRARHLLNLGQLSEWSNIGTSYFADYQVRPWTARVPECVVALVQAVVHHVPLWSPLGPADTDGVPEAVNVPTGDAGIFDDLGHIPLLRRGVSKLLIYDSSAVHDNSSGSDEANICEMIFAYAAFGQSTCLDPSSPPGASNPMMAAGTNTVFEASEFPAFIAQVRELYAAGKPIVVRGNYTVVENAFLGIKGGWKAEIVWVLGMPIPSWKEALPEGSRRLLPSFFPNYLANDIKSTFELAAISQFFAWITDTVVVKEVREMLRHSALAEESTPSAVMTV